MFQIKYHLRRQPTLLRRISNWSLGIGAAIILLITFLFSVAGNLPIELKLLYYFEIIGMPISFLIKLSFPLLLGGLILRQLSWRKGKLIVLDDKITIKGKKEFHIKYKDIFRLVKLKDGTIQIRVIEHPVHIKFRNFEEKESLSAILEEKNNGITLHYIS